MTKRPPFRWFVPEGNISGNILFGFGLGMVFANVVRQMMNKNLENNKNKTDKLNTNY